MEFGVSVNSLSPFEVLPAHGGRQDTAAEPLPRAATQEEDCRPTQQALGDARARLMQLDETLAMSLARGDVRLLSLQWLVKERPKKLLRRQDLEREYKGRAHLSARQAAALLRSGKRRVLSVSFGWRTPGDPDPTGEMLHDVLVFLDIFIEKHGITAAELAKYGIFWDFGSLCQKPRSDTEEKAFKRSLNIMAQLYSSAIGTCVLRYSLIPPRPKDYDGSVAVFFREGHHALDKWMKHMRPNGSAEPASISDKYRASESHDTEDELWKKQLPLSGSVETMSITECGTAAFVHYASHQDAESAVATLRQCVDEDPSGSPFAGACLQWNDRELCDRGWPTLELSVALEVIQRAKMKGFEAAKAVMEDVPIPKLYDITVCTSPEVVRGEEEPQPPQEVEQRIQNACFTSCADKEKVISLYRAHRDETFDKMNAINRYYLQWDNRVVDMQDERNRFGGACILSSRPLIRKSAEEVKRLQRRAERLSRSFSRAAHAMPVGLVQLADYASDIFVLARWARDEKRQMEFEVGLVFVCVSIGAVWVLAAFVIWLDRLKEESFKYALPWVATAALAPFNLHVLCLGMMPDDWLGGLGEGLRPFFFWLCKMLETGLESVPLSILTIAVLFDSQEVEDGLLWSSLGLSTLSMAYGFYGMCAYSQSTEGRGMLMDRKAIPSEDRVQSCRFTTFLAVLVHITWTLSALGVCWGSRDTLHSFSVILPAALLCTVFVSLVFGTLGLLMVIFVLIIKDLTEMGISWDFKLRDCTKCCTFSNLKEFCAVCFVLFFLVLCSVPLSIEAMAVDLSIFLAPLTEDQVMFGNLWELDEDVIPTLLRVATTRLLPVLRRLQLVVMAAAAVVASWPVPAHCAILCSLQAADLVASTWLWSRLRLINWPPWPFSKQDASLELPRRGDLLEVPEKGAFAGKRLLTVAQTAHNIPSLHYKVFAHSSSHVPESFNFDPRESSWDPAKQKVVARPVLGSRVQVTSRASVHDQLEGEVVEILGVEADCVALCTRGSLFKKRPGETEAAHVGRLHALYHCAESVSSSANWNQYRNKDLLPGKMGSSHHEEPLEWFPQSSLELVESRGTRSAVVLRDVLQPDMDAVEKAKLPAGGETVSAEDPGARLGPGDVVRVVEPDHPRCGETFEVAMSSRDDFVMKVLAMQLSAPFKVNLHKEKKENKIGDISPCADSYKMFLEFDLIQSGSLMHKRNGSLTGSDRRKRNVRTGNTIILSVNGVRDNPYTLRSKIEATVGDLELLVAHRKGEEADQGLLRITRYPKRRGLPPDTELTKFYEGAPADEKERARARREAKHPLDGGPLLRMFRVRFDDDSQELLPDVCLRDTSSAEDEEDDALTRLLSKGALEEEVEPEATVLLREAAARDGYLGLLDMLDGVVNTMGVPNSQSSLLAQEVSLVHELHLLCMELRGSLAELEPAGRGVVTAALAAYLPSSDGRSEGALLRALVPYAPSGSRFVDVLEAIRAEHGAEVADIAVQDVAPVVEEKAKAPKCPTGGDHLMEWKTGSYRVYCCDTCGCSGEGARWHCPLHKRDFCDNDCGGIGPRGPVDNARPPASLLSRRQAAMRGVSLAFALQRQVWTGTQTMLGGRKGLESFYDLSADVERVDYYISHAPGDDGSVKLRMLRAYLCIQPLIGTATVIEMVLAIILASLGFAIQENSKGFPWWILSAASIACYLCILVWIFFSLLGLMPFSATPWALTPFTLWVDICCVDSSTPEAIQLAVQSFPSFIDHSDRMIVFASSEYFGNLRCVFELAAFCYRHFFRLDDKLVMLSTSWRNSCHPCGSEKLTDEEQAWLRTFRCRTARCVKPADRAMLLEQIRKTWGSEERFEKFVRSKLPAVFQRSKTQYRRRAMTVALKSCEHVFGD